MRDQSAFTREEVLKMLRAQREVMRYHFNSLIYHPKENLAGDKGLSKRLKKYQEAVPEEIRARLGALY